MVGGKKKKKQELFFFVEIHIFKHVSLLQNQMTVKLSKYVTKH